MHFVTCTFSAHASEILDIFNDAILNSTALYDYKPRTLENMQAWFENKSAGNYPVIGAVNDVGELTGFASYGVFRAWPAYKYSVEHSVYVHKNHRGKGIGLQLMQQIIDAARTQDYHVMVGCIDQTNSSSIALHKKIGFTHAGTIAQAAYKFERWLDLGLYQLILSTPEHPNEM